MSSPLRLLEACLAIVGCRHSGPHRNKVDSLVELLHRYNVAIIDATLASGDVAQLPVKDNLHDRWGQKIQTQVDVLLGRAVRVAHNCALLVKVGSQ